MEFGYFTLSDNHYTMEIREQANRADFLSVYEGGNDDVYRFES